MNKIIKKGEKLGKSIWIVRCEWFLSRARKFSFIGNRKTEKVSHPKHQIDFNEPQKWSKWAKQTERYFGKPNWPIVFEFIVWLSSIESFSCVDMLMKRYTVLRVPVMLFRCFFYYTEICFFFFSRLFVIIYMCRLPI